MTDTSPLAGLLIEPTDTREVEVLGVRWILGAVPGSVMRRLSRQEAQALALPETAATRNPAYTPGGTEPFYVAVPGQEEPFAAAWDDAQERWIGTCLEWCRWGLRGAVGAAAPFVFEQVAQEGRTWPVATAASIQPLARAAGGSLAIALARAIHKANAITVEDVLGALVPGAQAGG